MTTSFFVKGIAIEISEEVISGWTSDRGVCAVTRIETEKISVHGKDENAWICGECKKKIENLSGKNAFRRAVEIVKALNAEKVVQLTDRSREIFEKEVEKSVFEEGLDRDQAIEKITSQFSDLADFLVADQVDRSLRLKGAMDLWMGFLDPRMWGKEKDDLIDQIIDHPRAQLDGKPLYSKGLLSKAYDQVYYSFKEDAWNFFSHLVSENMSLEDARRFRDVSDKSRQIHDLAKKIIDRVGYGFLPKKQFGMVLKATDSSLKRKVEELERREEEARKEAEVQREQMRAKKTKKVQVKKVGKRERIDRMQTRPRIPVRINGRDLNVLHAEHREEVDALDNGNYVYFQGEVVKVQKQPGGKVNLVRQDASIVEGGGHTPNPEKDSGQEYVPCPAEMWVSFDGEICKAHILDSQYFGNGVLEKIVSNLEIGSPLVKFEEGKNEMPIFEVVPGGKFQLGTCRKATKEEKRQAKSAVCC